MSKITHEQASDYVNSGDYYEPKGLIRKPMNDYIAQQEKLESSYHNFKWETDETVVKQEKLLELYKELSKLKDDIIHAVMFGKDYEHLRVKTVKIEQQIKELLK